MFGFLKSKTASQRILDATAEAKIKHGKTVWDSADVDRRTSLLEKSTNIQDDRIFLAYVQAPWSRLPYDVRLKLVHELVHEVTYSEAINALNRRMDHLEKVAHKAAETVALCFSVEQFIEYFGQKPFAKTWTFSDALGIWYSLGRFCFLISIGSLDGIKETDVNALLKLGQEQLMASWKMSESTLQRFEEFNGTKLADAYSIYKSIKDGQAFGQFFVLFVSEILGNDISFSPQEFSLGWLSQVLQSTGEFDMDPILSTEISSMFVKVKCAVQEYIHGSAV